MSVVILHLLAIIVSFATGMHIGAWLVTRKAK